jgi:hypothetical protein
VPSNLGPLCPFADCLNEVAVFDGPTGEPVACLDHIDLAIERWQAITIAPTLRETLPALYEYQLGQAG